jgi:hypothetical protein
MRSFAVTRVGTGSSAAVRVLHWQLLAGQPQVGHVRPLSLE